MNEIIKKLQFFLKTACAVMVVIGLLGCSQTTIPLAKAPPLYDQYKIQAVDHWDNVADAVAARVYKTYEDRPDLVTKPVYIVPRKDGIFTRTFASLLRTRLVTRGIQVAENYEQTAVRLEFDVEIVTFDSSRGDFGLSLASLGIGIGTSIVGGYTTTSNHEIVINSTMVERNRYVMSLSQICYINDDDWALYFNPASLQAKGESTDAIWQRYSARGQAFTGTPRPYQLPVEMNKNYSPTEYSSVGNSGSQPIIEEYIMPAGGHIINPTAPPTPIGKRKR